jgi:pimeloyl-ACP methyl ester carboxylesterase
VVFHSDRDEVVPIEEGRMLAAEIPNAIFVPLPTANHLLLQEEPARGKIPGRAGSFLALVRRFVAQTTRPPYLEPLGTL